ETCGESCFADGGVADEDDVLRASDEVEAGEIAELAAGDAGLALEREGLEGPLFGQSGSLDAPVEGGLLLAVPLGAQQAEQELGVGELLALGELQLVFEDLSDLAEMQIPEQLVELVVAHVTPGRLRGGGGSSRGGCGAGSWFRRGRARRGRSERRRGGRGAAGARGSRAAAVVAAVAER